MEEVLNGWLQVKPVKKGFISDDGGNEFEVVGSQTVLYGLGDIVVVEEVSVVKVIVDNKEEFFVKEENVLKVIRKDHGSDANN
jgi:hypothetical protein